MARGVDNPCVNHATRPAVAHCRGCGKRICELCVTVLKTRTFCAKCAAKERDKAPGAGKPMPGARGAANAKAAPEPEAPAPAEAETPREMTVEEEVEQARRSGATREELLAIAARAVRRRKAYLKIAFWRNVPRVLGLVGIVFVIAPLVALVLLVFGTSQAAEYFLKGDNQANPLAGEVVFFNARLDYELRNWETAIALYQQAIDTFPENKRVPDAHFMIALCHERLGAMGAARERLHLIMETYPNSLIAEKARRRINFQHW